MMPDNPRQQQSSGGSELMLLGGAVMMALFSRYHNHAPQWMLTACVIALLLGITLKLPEIINLHRWKKE